MPDWAELVVLGLEGTKTADIVHGMLRDMRKEHPVVTLDAVVLDEVVVISPQAGEIQVSNPFIRQRDLRLTAWRLPRWAH